MVNSIIFQNWLFADFILPFLLMFFLVFAILDRTKLLGEGKKQLNAIIALVIALIFSALFGDPKVIVSNLLQFMTVALVVAFVFLIIYGFVTGNKDGFTLDGNLKKALAGIVFIAVVVAVIWATGFNNSFIDLLFHQSWSETFWTNVLFIGVFVTVVAWVLKSAK